VLYFAKITSLWCILNEGSLLLQAVMEFQEPREIEVHHLKFPVHQEEKDQRVTVVLPENLATQELKVSQAHLVMEALELREMLEDLEFQAVMVPKEIEVLLILDQRVTLVKMAFPDTQELKVSQDMVDLDQREIVVLQDMLVPQVLV